MALPSAILAVLMLWRLLSTGWDPWFMTLPLFVLWIASALFFGWYALGGGRPDVRLRMRAAWRWGGAFAVTGFFGAALVPCLFEWGGNLCWILGPFVGAPLGAVAGLVLGWSAPDRPHRGIRVLLGGAILAYLLPMAGLLVLDVLPGDGQDEWGFGLARLLVPIGFVLGVLLVWLGPRLFRGRSPRPSSPLV